MSVLLAAAALLLNCRRIRLRKRTELMNSREIFGRLLQMIHFAGYMTGYGGTEKNFALKLAEELPCIEREEAEQLVETAARAAYGRDGADGEGEELLRQIYFRAGEWIAGELKGLRRLRFRYLKAFW